MFNPPRSTRNNKTPSFPEEMNPLMDLINAKELTAKSRLDEFRLFFDFKHEFWNKFHKKLKDHVSLSSSWAAMQDNESQRKMVAESFIDEVGYEYWGRKHAERYLLEAHIQAGHICVYPRDRKPALVPAREGCQKPAGVNLAGGKLPEFEGLVSYRLHSGWLDTDKPQVSKTPSPSSSMISEPPSSECGTIAVAKKSNPLSTPKSKSSKTKSPTAPKTKRSQSLVLTGKSPKDAAQFTPTPLTRGRCAMPGTALVASTTAARGAPSGHSTQPSRRESLQKSENLFTRSISTAPNTLATYFLVREDRSRREPVCVPFHNFEESQTTDDFLDEMEKRCRFEHDGSLLQLFADIPHCSYAVVLLRWSGVSFVMRRETDDLQSLMNRIGCAWRAKEEGELQAFEFAVEVTLRME
ncbi:uncharacterized protein N7482_008099 [Penicillium canariense]|uniref:Uncharacterized protein n=1 Tax=Penicillium canariense TaxID=189055 RepID=A0A9W9HV48_9EURO|nr:uncharacterized protein N7482_008099 [Penicillium canariense]KAJ5156999.1 hypothetical protein N7482_008099 [Penicillium canariense]